MNGKTLAPEQQSAEIAKLREENERLRHRVAELQSTEEAAQHAEVTREATEAHLRSVLGWAPIILWAVDKDGTITLSEGRALAGLGLKPGETVGQSVYQLYRDFPEVGEAVRDALAGAKHTSRVSILDRTFEGHSSPLPDAQGNIVGVMGVAIDVSHQKALEDSLRKAHDEAESLVKVRTAELERAIAKLQSEERLLRNLLTLQERDRQLIAYELHDGLVQDIVGGKMMLEAAAHNLAVACPEVQRILADAERLLSRAIDEGRRMISDLRPLIIDEKGIVAAIGFLVGEERSHSLVNLQFTHDVNFQRLPSLFEGTLFRIVQESLTNIRRHSQAHHASIDLSQRGRLLILKISDDGRGFDPATVPENHFGLQGIQRRAALFGGVATIESRPGRGATVRVELPLPEDE